MSPAVVVSGVALLGAVCGGFVGFWLRVYTERPATAPDTREWERGYQLGLNVGRSPVARFMNDLARADAQDNAALHASRFSTIDELIRECGGGLSEEADQ